MTANPRKSIKYEELDGPHPDTIHTYWLKKLTALQERLAAQMNQLLMDEGHRVRRTQCYTAAKDEDCSSVMKFQVCKREARTSLPKYGCIFLFLAVFVLSCAIDFKDIVENTVKYSIYIAHSDRHYNFCQFQPLSLKEAYEENLLLKSIAWPETPPLPFPFYLSKTSDPSHSTFTILSGRQGGQWQKGDNLEVLITIYDFHGLPKTSGGDVLLTRLHNPALGAGVAGQVVDHLNGSYTTVFYLPWEGNAEVEVTLVHPSEAVTVLRRLTRKHPDRIYFRSLFRSGSVSEITTCNVCLRPTQRPVCNYTDRRTGEPWFCYKPENLGCDARIDHSKGRLKRNFMTMETLFQRGVNMKVFIPASGSANVTILPKKEDRSLVNSHGLKSRPSGYYYHGVWRALRGTTVRRFNTSSAISQCLKGKVVHMYGDSTIRQWFEYFNTTLPDLKEFNLHSQKKIGPYMALDNANNILVTYRCHGPPIRFSKVPVSELRYIANELDSVTGGSNTVVVLGIWAHFSTFPTELYIRRLQSIRRAVVRLLSRAPDTRVVIRTANPKNLTLYETITNSDWYSLQQDKILKTMFKGLNVHLVDAWEMVVAHYLPHSLHPQPPIIKNMINVLLSYICPKKSD